MTTITTTGLKIDICFGCYASYNDGYLFDTWYTCYNLDDISKALKKFEKHVLKSIKTERPEWVKDGYINDETYAEELYLADFEIYYDGTYLDLDFGESIYDLKQWVENDGQYLDSLNNDFNFLTTLKGYLNTNKDLSDLDNDVRFYELKGWNVNEELGYEVANATCMLDEIPEHLKGYFDYEAFGSDLILGGDYFTLEINGTTYAIDNHKQ